MIFTGKRTGIIFNFTINVNPVFKYIEKIRGVQWYMMERKDLISNISSKFKKTKN